MTKPESDLITKIMNRLSSIAITLSMILMLLLTLLVIVEVASRYIFKFPIVYSSELYMLLFPWIIFLGAITVTLKDDHIEIGFLRERLPLKLQKVGVIFKYVVMLFVSYYMVLASWALYQNLSSQIMPILRFSRGWLIISMTICFAFIAIVLVYKIIYVLLGKHEVQQEEEGRV